MPTLTPNAFAAAFGISADELPAACLRAIEAADFNYEVLDGAARDGVILDVLRRLDTDQQQIAAPERRGVWHAGWDENLKEYRRTRDLTALVPRFIRPDQVVRWQQQYVRPRNPRFELDFVTVLRTWIYTRFIADVNSLHEFGCGTGFNLVLFGQMFPGKHLHGLDFVESSVALVNAIGQETGLPLQGHLFDMTEPDSAYVLPADGGVLTFGALEQLAGRVEAFLQFLLKKGPRVVVHIEPTAELYDETNLPDYLATRFHRKRGYTEGLLPRLQALEREGRLRLLHVRRTGFGSLFMEGYTCMAWAPR